MYQYAPLRERTLPDIPTLVKVFQQADAEDEKSRDIRPMMACLMRIAEAQDRLRGDIITLRSAVSSYDWELAPYDKVDADRAKQATLRLRRVIDRMLDYYADVSLYGVMGIEIAWNTAGTYGTTPYIVRRPLPDELESIGTDSREINLLQLNGTTLTRVPLAQESPQEWLLDRDDSFVRGGLIRAVSINQSLIGEQTQEWASLNRKLKGFLEVKWKQWASDKDKETGIAALRNLAKHNFAAMSDAINTIYTKVADAASGSSFESFKKELNNDSTICLLGNANITELPDHGGSRAAVETQRKVGADRHISIIKRLNRNVTDQLVLADFQLNGDAKADMAPWQFRVKLSDELDREKEARTVREAIDAGIPLRLDQVYENIGYSQPADGDAVIAGRETTPRRIF